MKTPKKMLLLSKNSIVNLNIDLFFSGNLLLFKLSVHQAVFSA